ncbi:endoribonuclease Dicer homolog 2 isoform X1 [Ziziphus jujuba]|uniref:Endoribonuclease Dicer homolog 2 isoform X1 n=2 Tax=Ziziphus jujuba TaxID=326968 RepID=A0ABM3IAP8_ZIZJJ|nr:endoribonuclease Dicer homolog 2 isoform X1 [Ziziphus jujuba]
MLQREDMEPVSMEIDGSQQLSADSLPFARNYQLEALEKAIKQNTIVYLETGSGKTLIAIMLLRTYAHLLRKPSPYIAVFLVPKVVLVSQQGEAVKMNTDLNVGMYWGDMGVDFWNAELWKKEIDKHEVLIMTPAILLDGLRCSFFKLSMIKVLILDECHHAKGNDPYACIMKEFYHHQLYSGKSDLPRIFGMTASPIKTKGGATDVSYRKAIQELENLMHSKVYTCANESVLSEFIPFSTPKFKFYRHKEIPYALYEHLTKELTILKDKHQLSLKILDDEAAVESMCKKIMKVFSAFEFCLGELGVWLAVKAAKSFSCNAIDHFLWEKPDLLGDRIVKNFSLDVCTKFSAFLPTNPAWTIGDDVKGNVDAGLMTEKVLCLIESLLEYRDLNDLRCIIFVERVITAIVVQSLLSEFLPKHNNWKTKYMAGNHNGLQYQTRKLQNEIVDEFRKGMVNIIVATSILEEGLDVQSCNLVIRFDPSATVCSFIQSRGRARRQNSDYILMVKSGDLSTYSRLEKYLGSGEIMRKESLSHASLPCSPVESDLCDGYFYCVESTGAIVTLHSSVRLIYFYCSRLPSDEYFKPTPRWDNETCTLHLPKSCPLPAIHAQGNVKILKQIACLEACKKLHQIGALTDNLVPDTVVEEDDAQETGSQQYDDEQPSYIPVEMVRPFIPKDASILYHCYRIELKQNFEYETPVHDVVLCMRSELDYDIANLKFDLQVDRGSLSVSFKYEGVISLNHKQVMVSRRFQITLFRMLMDHNLAKLREDLDGLDLGENLEIDYLLLPATSVDQRPFVIDWRSVTSVLFSCEEYEKDHINCSLPKYLHTKDGLRCACMLKNSLVYTPHNNHVYCITDILNLNGNSLLKLKNGRNIPYKNYYEERHGINLWFEKESLLNGRKVFKVQNCLLRCKQRKERESSNMSVELPPELCSIIMSPISLSTFYSFSFVPSIMHRVESLLLAVNLKRMLLDHCTQNVVIPTIKVLEAITTKECQEVFHLESLETLGDSFLKYAASQQLFKTYHNLHEGLLSAKKDKIISNAALCIRGCNRKLPGFIRNESFDPKKWFIPGDNSTNKSIKEEYLFNTKKIYISGKRKVKCKRVADVVEALIGAFLSTGGEVAAVMFLDWLGINVDLVHVPYERNFAVQPEKHINIRHLESQLNYSFNDPSLLVEALTHGSYMLPQIPRCYQRLEFLGDAVLDYLITIHLYYKFPGLSPGLLTDMRSAQVNNDCYARCSVKAGLHKHILHLSRHLHKHIAETIDNFGKLSSESTFGWETETSFPKVLGDVIESLAGAIFVDSGYSKEKVFESIRPLLEPLVTPETVKQHPAKELNELCQQMHYDMKKPVKCSGRGQTSVTIEVKANGVTYKHTEKSSDKDIAKKVACKKVLKALKQANSLN